MEAFTTFISTVTMLFGYFSFFLNISFQGEFTKNVGNLRQKYKCFSRQYSLSTLIENKYVS